MKKSKRLISVNRLAAVLFGLVFALFLTSCGESDAGESVSHDPLEDWGAAESFLLEEYVTGFELPTSMAFVSNPGKGAKDPKFFVAELFGTIKVVSNDGTVAVFAEGFFPGQADRSFETNSDEFGLAGLCLADDQGFLYATFVYRNPNDQLLYNGMIRFETKANVFSSSYEASRDFSRIFEGYATSPSHQIGSCQVDGDSLFISVGDGENIGQSQELNSIYGKILRMDLNGEPKSDNPFFNDDGVSEAIDYVWAYGMRNPFGLKAVNGRIFSADNGLAVDRFIEIYAGENYLWDGTDYSIGAKADSVISPAIGPVQMDYVEGIPPFLPAEYGNTFFVSASSPKFSGILNVNYSLSQNQMLNSPDFVLRYRGNAKQIVTALAIGPDGLYFAPMLPNQGNQSSIYRLFYSPTDSHPYGLTDYSKPRQLIRNFNCLICHNLENQGGDLGPSLDRADLLARLEKRFESEEYQIQLDLADSIDKEPFNEFDSIREELRVLNGMERIKTWMIYHLVEPKFDNPYAQMPNFGLTIEQAEIVTDYLVESPEEPSIRETLSKGINDYIFDLSHLSAFIIGIVASISFPYIYRRISRK